MRLRIFSKRDAGNRLLPAVVLAGSVVLYGALTMAARGRGSVLEDRRLERDRYGGDERQYELLVEGLSGERELPVTVRVGARAYSEEEAEEVFIRLMDGMEERIRGENASLMDIRTDLTLPKWFEEEGIRASWYSSDGELLDAAGKLGQQVTENQELTLSVALSDGIHKSTYEIPVRLVPGEQTGEEKLVADFRRELEDRNVQQEQSSGLVLPESFQEHSLRYRLNQGNGYEGILGGGSSGGKGAERGKGTGEKAGAGAASGLCGCSVQADGADRGRTDYPQCLGTDGLRL